MHSYPLLSLFSLSIIMYGCSGSGSATDQRLIEAERLIVVSPQAAVDSLRSIDYHRLSDADRHHYDFLSVKSADKAYITHASDSLILSVIDYESRHKGNGRYPEALYYGGRVYSDLGDYPTALKYFQDALDIASPESNMHLRGNILSQTARLLNDLRLYDEAIPYLKECLHLDSIENDTFNLTYDHQLLGAIYFHKDSLDLASNNIQIAKTWAQNLSEEDISHMQLYQAAIAFRQGDIPRAISLIRHIPDNSRPIQQSVALAYASDIYRAAGIYDTAYVYASRIIHIPSSENITSGYRNIFSPELSTYIPQDSIFDYIRGFYTALENAYNSLESQQILNQISYYNYAIHQRERQRVETIKNWLVMSALILLLIVVILISVVLVVQYKRKKTLLELNSTIIELENIQKNTSNAKADSVLVDTENVNELKRRLKIELENFMEQKQTMPPISPIILNSPIYKKLQSFIHGSFI